jgi:hypothetical protein
LNQTEAGGGFLREDLSEHLKNFKNKKIKYEELLFKLIVKSLKFNSNFKAIKFNKINNFSLLAPLKISVSHFNFTLSTPRCLLLLFEKLK